MRLVMTIVFGDGFERLAPLHRLAVFVIIVSFVAFRARLCVYIYIDFYSFRPWAKPLYKLCFIFYLLCFMPFIVPLYS